MSVDLAAAEAFLAAHARVLDRRRFQLLMGKADPGSVVAALDAYRNPDGGYGWGLEPDLRSPESQPGAALHAFEVFGDIAPATAPQAVALCDWLASVSLADGGLPFALPVTNPAGCAPFWAQADPTVSSLQITAVVAATAHRVAVHDPAVAAHPWLAQATRSCLAAIRTCLRRSSWPSRCSSWTPCRTPSPTRPRCWSGLVPTWLMRSKCAWCTARHD